MSRSARGELPRAPIVDRHRLLARLEQRFETRVTTVVGGAGSGKTTVLAQMLAADHEHSDVWYAVRSVDRDPIALAHRLGTAVRVELGIGAVDEPAPPSGDDTDLTASMRAIGELVLSAAPRRVCLVLDDAHLLADGVLDALLERLPANGHLLVASRSTPPLSLARLRLRNDVTVIDQDDLMFDDEELVGFANQRGLDASVLAGADRWPAFVELAAEGRAASTAAFLDEETLTDLDPERRRGLGRFGLVGGGDDDLAQAIAGMPLDRLVAGLPLVRWSGESARLHDIWVDLLLASMSADERVDAATAGVHHLLARRDVDRAIELAARHGLDDLAEHALTVAIDVGVDGGLRASLIERWLTMLPADRLDRPAGLLARGVVERDRDPSAPIVRSLFDASATAFEADGDQHGELLALQQLVFVARFAGDSDVVPAVTARLAELASVYPPARPYLGFAAAFRAIAAGRPDLQLEELDRLVEVDLPPMWRSARENLRAHALYLLGRPAEALEVAPSTGEQHGVTFPGGSVTESQALWFAGRPDEAMASQLGSIERETSARDRFKAHAWVGVMAAFAGHVDVARDHRARAERLAGDVPPAVGIGQLVGIDILLQLATDKEADAAAASTSLLELAPLGQGVSEQNLRPLLALPYLMVPDTRDFWESIELGPAQLVALDLARAFAAAREGDLTAIARLAWPSPGVVAANLPVRWAVEFALHGVRAGVPDAHRTLRWLCERWGSSARSVLRDLQDDAELGAAAGEVWARTPIPPRRSVRVEVLGSPRLLIDGDDSPDPDWRRERVRALLVWLILHRSGSRDQLAGALWPDLSADRAAKNLRTTLNLLHQVLEPGRRAGDATWFVQSDGPWIHLRDDTDIDLVDLTELLDRADESDRTGRSSDTIDLLRDAIALYRGDLASDLDLIWLDLERVHVRSRFVRAAARLSELLLSSGRPDEAIDAASTAVRFDPYHDRSLHAMADAYLAVGDNSAAAAVRARMDELV